MIILTKFGTVKSYRNKIDIATVTRLNQNTEAQHGEDTSPTSLRVVQGWLGNRYVANDGAELNWTDDFKDFCEDTSAHGVRYVFYGRYKVIKIIFLLISLLAIAYAIFVITTSAISFIGKPVGTKFQVMAEEADAKMNSKPIRFPAASLCSQNKVSNDWLKDKKGLKNLLEKIHTCKYDVTSKINWKSKINTVWRDVTYETIIREAGPSNWTLLQCTIVQLLTFGHTNKSSDRITLFAKQVSAETASG